jgi:hypothetical protein
MLDDLYRLPVVSAATTDPLLYAARHSTSTSVPPPLATTNLLSNQASQELPLPPPSQTAPPPASQAQFPRVDPLAKTAPETPLPDALRSQVLPAPARSRWSLLALLLGGLTLVGAALAIWVSIKGWPGQDDPIIGPTPNADAALESDALAAGDAGPATDDASLTPGDAGLAEVAALDGEGSETGPDPDAIAGAEVAEPPADAGPHFENPQESCNHGEITACMQMASELAVVGAPLSDWTAAGELLDRACAGNQAGACAQYATLLVDGPAGTRNYNRAAELFRTLCQASDFVSCRRLGELTERGRGTLLNRAGAFELYNSACNGGEVSGCVRLGMMLMSGSTSRWTWRVRRAAPGL